MKNWEMKRQAAEHAQEIQMQEMWEKAEKKSKGISSKDSKFIHE